MNLSPTLHRWSRVQWERLVASGCLDGEPVELIDGKIPSKSAFVLMEMKTVAFVDANMRGVFDEANYWVRTQMPLRLEGDSQPEPDVAVVAGSFRDFPATVDIDSALLVIEVSESTLNYDRGDKASLYASAGIADYWIINLVDRQCEVHHQPVTDASCRFGFRYADITVMKPNQTIRPVAADDKPVRVADLLP